MPPNDSHIIAHCFRGCCDFRRHVPNDEPVHIRRYCQYISAKFLLEVCGASGAIWGSTQVFFLRETELATEIIRTIALFIGLIFAVRFWWNAKHYYQHDHDFPVIKEVHRRKHYLPFFQIHSSKFILEVLGGTGAIWGCAEAMYLRNSTNEFGWRVAAAAAGSIFFIRWTFQIFMYCLCLMALWSDPTSFLMKAARWYDALVSKLILEVFGAAGAVWGFSEIVHLRNPNNLQYWHPAAIAVFAIFFIRWVLILISFFEEERRVAEQPKQIQPEETRPDEVKDLELEVNDAQVISPANSLDITETSIISPTISHESKTSLNIDNENADVFKEV